jgi:Fe-S-cluster-containing hydrogenase component 2
MIDIDQETCVGCRLCTEVCPAGAMWVTLGRARVNPLKCTGCGRCLDVCPRGAIQWKEDKVRRKIPPMPYVRRSRSVSPRFVPGRKGFTRRGRVRDDLNELKGSLKNLKQKSDEILERIEMLQGIPEGSDKKAGPLRFR